MARMTFFQFNTAFPGDARRRYDDVDCEFTVFCPTGKACEICVLAQLIDTPPDAFMIQLSKLSDDANCSN